MSEGSLHSSHWVPYILLLVICILLLIILDQKLASDRRYVSVIFPTFRIPDSETNENVEVGNDNVSNKYVLVWFGFYGSRYNFDANPDYFKNCPESRCVMGSNRERRSSADAIFFCVDGWNHRDLPHHEYRNPDQYYIFHRMESPDTTKKLIGDNYRNWDIQKDFFNLTFTYRLDSDIFDGSYLSGYIPHIINTSAHDPLWFFTKRDVLWFVSNCETASNREAYVAELRKYLQIDTVGRCHNVTDPCKGKGCSPDGHLLPRYKFYLSMENRFDQNSSDNKI